MLSPNARWEMEFGSISLSGASDGFFLSAQRCIISDRLKHVFTIRQPLFLTIE
jgi:hypothetical protein